MFICIKQRTTSLVYLYEIKVCLFIALLSEVTQVEIVYLIQKLSKLTTKSCKLNGFPAGKK